MTSAVPAPSREMSSLVAALEEGAILTAPTGRLPSPTRGRPG